MRQRAIAKPVTLFHDGKPFIAEAGEPVALSLLAAGVRTIARSSKLHRPRGPYCFRGNCDGCLARVNGEPNRMTCLIPAEENIRIETQNSLGSRRFDLLRATDFAFPSGFDHHKLLAGTPLLGPIMQQMARRIAGVGELKAQGSSPLKQSTPSAHHRALPKAPQLLLIGAGRTGATIALKTRQKIPSLEICWLDASTSAGGGLRLVAPEAWSKLESACADLGLYPSLGHRVLGLYLNPSQARTPTALVGKGAHQLGPGAVEAVQPQVVVLATGAHDAVSVFPGNDLPGVYSARAGLIAWDHGILIGKRIGLVGQGAPLEAFERLVQGRAELLRLPEPEQLHAIGQSELRGARYLEGDTVRRARLDALLVGGPGAAASELAVQAGFEPAYQYPQGYFIPPTSGQAEAPGIGYAWRDLRARSGEHHAAVSIPTSLSNDALEKLSSELAQRLAEFFERPSSTKHEDIKQ